MKEVRLSLSLAILVVFACVVIFTATELFIRHRIGGARTLSLQVVSEFDSPFIYVLSPNTAQDYFPHRAPVNINNQSFRRTMDTPVEKPTDTYRILSYGDSIGFGHHVDEHQTYAYEAESALNSRKGRRRNYEVLNMARGHSPTTYSYHIRKDVPLFKPDLVVLEVELINDLGDEAMVRFKSRDSLGLPDGLSSARYILSRDCRAVLNTLPVGPAVLRRFDSVSRFSVSVGSMLSNWFPSELISKRSNRYLYNLGFDEGLITEKRVTEALHESFLTLKAIELFVTSHGSQFLLVILPSRFFFDGSEVTSYARWVVEQGEKHSALHSIRHVSLSKALTQMGGASLFMDFCHPNELGHRELGRLIVDSIADSKGSPEK